MWSIDDKTMILEQFCRLVDPELKVWIKKHAPDITKEIAQLTEVFISIWMTAETAVSA